MTFSKLKTFSSFSAVLPCSFNTKRYFSSRTTRPSYYHYIGREPLAYRTIGQQLDIAAQNFGDIEALVSCHEQKRFTFSTVKQRADELAAAFIKIGLERGDRIGLWAPNNSHWYISMMAAARAGLVVVGINPAFQAREMEYCLNKVGVKAIVAPEKFKSTKYYEILEKIAPEINKVQPGCLNSKRVPSLKSVIIDSENQLPGAFQYSQLFDMADSRSINEIQSIQHLIQPDSPCNIQFTSGTTGAPKAAVLSHFNFVNNGIHIGYRNELANRRICVQVPLFHAFGVVISIMAGATSGATLVLPEASYNPVASLKAIANENCSILHGTPTMYVDLIDKQKELKMPIETAEIAITGGAPCSPQLFSNIKEVLGLKKVKTVYGLTETTAVIFQSMHMETEEQILTTVGHIQDHIEAKVIDLNGEAVPFGQPGELCVRGYLNFLEYFEDIVKTNELMDKDGWLKTGDQFILEENGYGKIVGRLKDVIIRGGENIYPKEIEDFLNTHPDISETHVVGVSDERLGEDICAFVKLRNGIDNITQSQIKEFCKGNISHFKIPRHIRVIKDFPKTTSGKIQKFKLIDIFKEKER